MKIIIIGGVAAGMSAASKLKRLNPEATVHVYEKGLDLSYSACGMPYYLGDVITDEKKLIARFKEDFEKEGIHVFLRHEVIKVDPEKKHVEVKNLELDNTFIDNYDKLLIATGTVANRTNVPGSDKANIYGLNELEDMRILKPLIKKGQRVAIIGGGYIGVEVAENLASLGLDVHIVELGKQVLSIYDFEVAQKAQKALEAIGVVVHVNEQLKAYEVDKIDTVVVTDQGRYAFDVVIEAIGVRPNTAFLKDIGFTMLKNGAIVINEQCETSLPDIYAAGDCVSYYHRITKENVYVPLGTHANKTGRVVAENMAGHNTRFPGIVGSNIIKVADLTFAKTGLGVDEAKKLGIDLGVVDITAKHKPGYYPGAKELFVRIVYDKATGVLKGAQLVGEAGVSDRINIMALAISNELTAKEFSQLDFAYAPPFSPVWDPLLIATNQIKV